MRVNRQEASLEVVEALCAIGYITGKDKRTLIYRLNTGDITVYDEIRGLLITLAAEIKI